MSDYARDQIFLGLFLAAVFGFISLLTSSLIKENGVINTLNYKRSLRVVGYLLILGALLQTIGLLFSP